MCRCLPLLQTLGVSNHIESCILQLDTLKCQGSTQRLRLWRQNGAHKGDTVLTLCLNTLNNVISDSEGLWANQSFCYWTSSGDYSSWTFDFSRCQTELCPWNQCYLHVLHISHLLNKTRCSFPAQHEGNPQQCPWIFMNLKQLCRHKFRSRYFQLSPWRVKRACTENLACVGKHTSTAETE